MNIQVLAHVCTEISRVLVGQRELVEQLLISLFCQAPSQIEGAAGTGKWIAVEALAQCLGLQAGKLRCSEDLGPEDLVPPLVHVSAEPSAPPGPLFANVVLVDRIHLLAPRVHNLLQQAMQEKRLEVRGKTWELPDPSVIFATREPIEEGESENEPYASYDDRYLFRITVPYPPYDEEFAMGGQATQVQPTALRPVLERNELSEVRNRILNSSADPAVIHYAVRLVRATRVHEGENPDFVFEWVHRGAGPRGVHALILGAKARAILHGRTEPTLDDVRAMAFPALRHRIVTNRNAQANGITPDRVIYRLIDEIPARIEGDESPPQPGESFTLHDWVPRDE